jgi:hypothetical protein
MSTRCNIVMQIGQSKIYLYRHCDGYLAETGADILVMLRESWGTADAHRSPEGAANAFLRSIMAAHYEQQSYEKKPRPIYELTNGLHGDIEHAYFVDFEPRFNTGPISIRHCSRPAKWHTSGLEVEDWVGPLSGRRYSLEAFSQAVNRDREECNRRLKELARTSKHYADATPYAMV